MAEFLDAIAERQDCSATVVYFGESAPERKWGGPTGSLPFLFLKGIKLSGGFRINPGLLHALRKTRVDVWVVNTVYSSPSTLIAAWWLNRNSVAWAYMNEPPRPRQTLISPLKSLLLQFVLQRASGVIGMGRKAESIYRTYLNENQPTNSIPYYIDLKKFLRLSLPSVPDKEQGVHFITSCQMIERKGLDILLRACELLSKNGWLLTLVGDGPLRSKLEREFVQRRSDGKVTFTGEISFENRSLVFEDKHVFVFPSRWDGWGMVVPEALASGLPVVSTDQVISAHEFIRHAENGFIISSDDPKALADKMNWFIQNRESIPLMGLAARKSVKDYRPELGAERLVQFLSKLADSQKPSIKAMESERSNFLTWKQLTESPISSQRSNNKLRNLSKKLIISGALAAKPRKKPNGNRILVYHLVLKEDRKKFEEHLRLLIHNFRVCSVSEVLNSARNTENQNIPCIAITFDDGCRLLMEDCLELLERFGIKACFYVPTGFVELSDYPESAAQFSVCRYYYNLPLKPMRPEDLKLLVDFGHEVGSHGISHISLGAVTRKVAEKELNLSRRRIYEWTGKEPISFAYPYGDLKSSIGYPPDWVRGVGYENAVTLNRGLVAKSNNPFILPRDHAEGNWSVRDLLYFLFS
jgi:glycosyltransferase involved in cell wall biosynthesis/peptidoglycan/xylan/chitin deacetylase (PgdA/CDA1 family)